MSKAWDKIFLLVSLVALIGLAVYLGLSTADLASQLRGSANATGKFSKPPEVLKADELAQKKDNWLQPKPWDTTEKDHQLFVGRRYLYFPGEKAVKLYEDNLLIDGLPLSWIEKYKLPISDVLVGHRDPDGDGFSNITEFKAGTDPLDIASHPAYISIMRVKERTEKAYRIKFQNKSEIEGQWQFQLSTPDSTTKHTRQVKKDEVFDEFQVVDFEAKSKPPEPPAFETDISELKLLNQKSQDQVVLVINKEQNVPEVSVSFVLLTPALVAAPVTARVGEEFSITVNLPNNQTAINKYKLVKSTPDTTTVLDEASGSTSVIPAFDAKEADDVVPKELTTKESTSK